MSAEDLTTQAGLAVQQDLALVALLGLGHVERNGHHYVRGLAALPRTEQAAFLAAHPDLYVRDGDLVRLRIDARPPRHRLAGLSRLRSRRRAGLVLTFARLTTVNHIGLTIFGMAAEIDRTLAGLATPIRRRIVDHLASRAAAGRRAGRGVRAEHAGDEPSPARAAPLRADRRRWGGSRCAGAALSAAARAVRSSPELADPGARVLGRAARDVQGARRAPRQERRS